jgi:hypothetical protein
MSELKLFKLSSSALNILSEPKDVKVDMKAPAPAPPKEEHVDSYFNIFWITHKFSLVYYVALLIHGKFYLWKFIEDEKVLEDFLEEPLSGIGS